jgi:hypothetical protein
MLSSTEKFFKFEDLMDSRNRALLALGASIGTYSGLMAGEVLTRIRNGDEKGLRALILLNNDKPALYLLDNFWTLFDRPPEKYLRPWNIREAATARFVETWLDPEYPL